MLTLQTGVASRAMASFANLFQVEAAISISHRAVSAKQEP
jgi:hypothetical protein